MADTMDLPQRPQDGCNLESEEASLGVYMQASLDLSLHLKDVNWDWSLQMCGTTHVLFILWLTNKF
jgi:hypothetical protein